MLRVLQSTHGYNDSVQMGQTEKVTNRWCAAPMKIALVGTHCAGKTTTLLASGAAAKIHGQLDNVTVLQETARGCPYAINTEGTFETSVWILFHQILAELEAHRKWKHIITDRSVYDEIIYAEQVLQHKVATPSVHGFAHLLVEQKRVNYIRQVAEKWCEIHPYDHIFLFDPLPLIPDPDRSPDPAFQQSISQLFESYFCRWPAERITHVKQRGRETRAEYVAKRIVEMIQENDSK